MKFKKTLSLLLLMLCISLHAFSQDDCGPGDVPSDPDAPYTPPTCEVPLDTWVYVLVAGAAVFGTYQLYRKQKTLPA